MGARPGTEGSDAEQGAGLDRLAIAGTLIAIAIGAAVILAVDPLREAVGNAIRGDTDALRDELRGYGAGGVAILYVLILAHTVVWYPTEIVDAAGGFVYGFWGGLALVHVGWVIQGVIAWTVGREVARPAVRRLVGPGRFDEVERRVEHGGVALLLAMRFIPIVPFSLFSYVAGATRVPLVRFTWTTAVGYLPLTALFVYVGSRLDSLSPTDPLVLVGAAVLVAVIVFGHRVTRRGRRHGD